MADSVDFRQLRERAGPYPPQAYRFVNEGLAHTVQMVRGAHAETEAGDPRSRHVSGQQLCLGLRDYALRQYGRLARGVLASWHIHETADFGRMVFAMIDAGLMRKNDEDCFEDFEDVFDFDEAFEDLPAAR